MRAGAKVYIKYNPDATAILSRLVETQYLGIPDLRDTTGLPEPRVRGIMRRLYLDGVVTKSRVWHKYNDQHCRLKKYTINSEIIDEIKELLEKTKEDTMKATDNKMRVESEPKPAAEPREQKKINGAEK